MNSILLFDSFGYIVENNINYIVHGWLYRSFFFQDNILNKIKNFKYRTKYLLSKGLDNRKITIYIEGKEYKTITDKYGHFYIPITHSINNIKSKYIFDVIYDKYYKCNVQILDYDKKIIISDIDDTIKDTNVLNKVELLKNILYRDFKPIKNMSELYNKIAHKYNFCYLTATPWQMYLPINEFLREYKFPQYECAIYKKVNINNICSIRNFLDNTRTYKYVNIENIIRSTKENLILIGDNTEFDELVYNDITVKYTDRIDAIFIRQVSEFDILSKFNDKIKAKVHIFYDGNDKDFLEKLKI